jgi:hypothetical protein
MTAPEFRMHLVTADEAGTAVDGDGTAGAATVDGTAGAGCEAATRGDLVPRDETALALELRGREQTGPERAAIALGHWLDLSKAAIARRYEARPDGLLRGLLHAKPESLAEHRNYVRSRAWVPEGHEGSLIPGIGVLYHNTIGVTLVALGNAISALGARQLRFMIACLVVGSVVAVLAVWG